MASRSFGPSSSGLKARKSSKCWAVSPRAIRSSPPVRARCVTAIAFSSLAARTDDVAVDVAVMVRTPLDAKAAHVKVADARAVRARAAREKAAGEAMLLRRARGATAAATSRAGVLAVMGPAATATAQDAAVMGL